MLPGLALLPALFGDHAGGPTPLHLLKDLRVTDCGEGTRDSPTAATNERLE